MLRHRFALVPLFLLVLGAAAPARAQLMRDSTTVDAWRLANGLEVRVRSIPGAAGASVSLAYRAGALHMPPGRGSLARVLAEVQLTAAAGQTPERTRNELATLRPAGWDLRTNDHVTVITEVATRSQIAGVLLQAAERAHGVQPSDSCLRRSLATVRTAFAREALGDPTLVLHRRVRDVALGKDDATILAEAQGRELDGIRLTEVTELLERLYVPANASLAIAGDVGGLDLHALVEKLFGDIPAGKAEPELRSPTLRPGERVSTLQGLTQPVGVIGVFAPSLDDTMHASFYLAALLAGSGWHDHVGPPKPPLSSVFQYSLFDQPDLVRFFVQPSPDLKDTTTMVVRWATQIDALRANNFLGVVMDQARLSVDWLLGGTLSPMIRKALRRETAPLTEMSAAMATRATWRGDAFWNAWRGRFETSVVSPHYFFTEMLTPGNHAAVLLQPRR